MSVQDNPVPPQKFRTNKLTYKLTENDMEQQQTATPIGAASNRQVGGDHYKKYRLQPYQFAEDNNLSFLQGLFIKYIIRNKEEDDFKKALHVVELLEESVATWGHIPRRTESLGNLVDFAAQFDTKIAGLIREFLEYNFPRVKQIIEEVQRGHTG